MKTVRWSVRRLGLLLAGWHLAATLALGTVNPSVYMAIGDGITYGSVYDIVPWPQRLDSLLGSGKTVVNESKAASRVGYGSAKINGWLATHQPGYLLILYGSNDLGVNHSASYIIGELQNIIRSAKANHAVPVVGTLPPIQNGNASSSAQNTLNSRIRQLALDERIQCADVSAAFNNRSSLLMDDGLHPTSEGQQLIAHTFHQAILASALPWELGYRNLGGGWRRLAWFGDYVPMGSAGWIWHRQHGFFYVSPSAVQPSIWLFAGDMGWLWTTSTSYPFIYRSSDRAWLWYNGGTNPRWFMNFKAGRWEYRL